jgi:hypothetical protein
MARGTAINTVVREMMRLFIRKGPKSRASPKIALKLSKVGGKKIALE